MSQQNTFTDQVDADTQSSATTSAVANSASKVKASLRGSWKESVDKGIKTMEGTETVMGTHRQIIDAGLMGICITFLVTILAMQLQDIDASLNNAITAFAVALPLIGWGYLQAAIQMKPGRENIFLQSLLIGSAVGESVGELAVGVGMFFIFLHFSSSSAAGAFVWAAVSAIVFVPILAFIGLFVYAIVNHKELAAKQQAATASKPVLKQKETEQVATDPQP